MKKYITFILILCILCQCALFSISANHGGLAKNFKITGRNSLTITWSEGQRIGSGAQITNEV